MQDKMKRIIFIWSSPHIFGIPWEQFVVKKRVVYYCSLLNNYFRENEMNYAVDVDITFGALDRLFEKNDDIWIFLEGNKKRYWIYRDEILEKEESIYYLSKEELYSGEIDKFLFWLSQRCIK